MIPRHRVDVGAGSPPGSDVWAEGNPPVRRLVIPIGREYPNCCHAVRTRRSMIGRDSPESPQYILLRSHKTSNLHRLC